MTDTALRAVIKGTGSALPRNRVSNAELAKRVDTTDEWIVERTGIRFRHIAEADETTATLGAEAARKALETFVREHFAAIQTQLRATRDGD